MGDLSPLPIWQTNPTAAQAQTQGSNLACPSIHPICGLLEHVKGPDMQGLHNTGQQQDVQKESNWEPSI